MAKTVFLIHGRDVKPKKKALREIYISAIEHGLARDRPAALAQFKEARVEFIYYGDVSNELLDPSHDTTRDAKSRWETLDALKSHSREDFLNKDVYRGLPGRKSWRERLADTISGPLALLGLGDNLIKLAARDMALYWDEDTGFGSRVRFPIIKPLKAAMRRGDEIMIIAHSLGSMIAYDTLWKFSRSGEYRPTYTEKKIDVLMTIGSPLGDENVKARLRGAGAAYARRYPSNIKRWVNIAAEDDFIAHDEEIANDFRKMSRWKLVDSIEDHSIYNLSLRHGESNPHHASGYLMHPKTVDVLAKWLN